MGVVALLLLWLLIKAFVIGASLLSLRTHQNSVQTLLDNGLTQINGDELETIILGVHQDVRKIKSETAVFYPLLTRLGWIPKYGPTLTITPQLLDLAVDGTETAAFAIRGLKPALSVLQTDSLTGEEQLSALLQIIHQAEPDIHQASLSLQNVIGTYETIGNIADQPEQLQTLFGLATEWLPIADDGLKFLTILPEIAGIDGPKSYLILAQNEDELRATGGFISGSGVLTINNGQLSAFEFQDAYQVDDFSKPYGDPPTALYDVMGLELFLFRDSNFWPDFPSSAQQSMALYSYGLNLPELDGAIAFNQSFLENLLEVTGPVQVSASNVTLTSGNVKQALQNAWEAGSGEAWRGDRKQFLGTFALALQEQFFSNIGALNPVTLAQEVTSALNAQNLQIYMSDPTVAATLDALNWDGRLENPSQSDYLLIVDSNTGFNKTNLFIERQLDYEVTISQALVTSSALEITYTHNGKTASNCAQDDVLVPIQPTYSEISNQCYWNYMRVYTPENSVLTHSGAYPISQERLIVDNDWAGVFRPIQDLPNWSVFDNFLLIESGQSVPYQIEYRHNGLIQEVQPGAFPIFITARQSVWF